jgi:hypothetical protein
VIAGIIGKPNSGKSTFFNASTLLNAQVASYPFTTIKPNFGVGYIRVKCVCKEFNVKDNPQNSTCINGNRFIPVKLIDVAGLVPGASSGKGLGNKFLDDLRQADSLIHVVDASGSTDEEGKIVKPSTHNPIKDVEFVEREFDLWLFGIVKKDWGRISRTADAGSEKLEVLLAERLSGLAIGEEIISKVLTDLNLRGEKVVLWGDEKLFNFCSELRKNAKPALIAANRVDIQASKDNISKLKESGRLVIPCAAEAELLLRRACEKGLIEYLPGDSDFKIKEDVNLTNEQVKALELVREKVLKVWGNTGVQQAINSAYLDLLSSVVVYPVEDESRLSDKKGNVLPDAYVMPKGSTAKDLAYKVHTDIGRNFLYAVDVRSGLRLSADYTLRNNDVIKIVSAAR